MSLCHVAGPLVLQSSKRAHVVVVGEGVMDKFLSPTSTQLGEVHDVVDTTPKPTLNTTHIDLKSPKKEVDGEPPTTRKKPTRNSTVWDHFTKVKDGNPNDPSCTCNYCGKDYACDSRRVGTSSLWVHLNNQCKKYPYRVADKKQKLLSFQSGNDGGGNLLAVTFNKERCRKALAKFVIKDEQAFSVVEGEGLKEFVQDLQPKFVIPSRRTVTRDIYQYFCDERVKLKEELTRAGQRVCLTTDYWTSSTQIAYMCLTAHYVDSDWNLQKRIINFCQISNHKGETIGKGIETCLLGWGIEKVFAVTVDNASANDVAVGFVKRRVNAWNGYVLDGEFMQVRCGVHIVNLIGNEGLKDMHDSIAAIRNCVRYIRSSPARLLKFKACVDRERIDYKGGLVLDVPTRWNSTFMMLDVALKFEKAFARYEEEDDKFVSFFMENEHGKKRVGPPTSSDWESATIFVKFLSTFYEVTLKFSGTLHVTSNNFYHEICEIHTQLSDLASSSDPLLSTMAASMKRKYDKYWGSAENINPMLFLAVVLNPRYKLKYLKYCFETVYDAETVAKIVVKVEQILQRLYNSYNVQGESDGDKVSKSDSPPKGGVKETIRRRLLENYLQQQQMFVTNKMNDVDKCSCYTCVYSGF
ncbi:zinc finger BED domain-containing protein RICESLEEPER 1-like [Humulus lupulus]|uniref:zinc finger BED domain-containing protein RICESLEEPER 1-like n=1 Tax=Humulus lupulus TaxID=3486 RepID=UPI002B417D24|nr:zinc finger BED domain-containing protein RICESLEEPER 1-like [Humulus lupulus]